MKEFFETGFGLGLIYFIVILFLILGGVAADRVFLEPKRQEGYVANTTSLLTDWCGASPTDAWNMQTLTELISARDGKPDRFNRMPHALQTRVNAAAQGDRVTACGHE